MSFLPGDYNKMYPDYIAAINRLDDNVGKLVKKLKEKGLYDNTIIIYTSDHGSHLRPAILSIREVAMTAQRIRR